jgi:iron complex outermembrane receptor protein
MNNSKPGLIIIAVTALIWGVSPNGVFAQNQTAGSKGSESALEEIIVTARKRDEALIDIPMSITAISAESIEAAGLQDLQDIALLAPGLDFQNQGSFLGGRALGQISFRGMNLERVTFSNQLGALFVDGIYVLGGAQSIPLGGIERVEVIKGPQNAYFGRNTFAGAINYVMKKPTENWEGLFEADLTDAGSHRFALSAGGPLGDKFALRVGASSNLRGSEYTATDGGKLGEESTELLSATGYYSPSDQTTFKLGVSYLEDRDTSPASTFLSAFDNGNCSQAVTFPIRGGGSVTSVPDFICGAVPGVDTVRVSHNTSLLPTNLAAPNPANIGVLFPFSPLNGFPLADAARALLTQNPYNDPVLADAPTLDRMGLARDMLRVTFNAEHEFDNGMSLTVNAGYNELQGAFTNDLDRTDVEGNLAVFPLGLEDYTVEAIVRSDQSKRLTWLVGASYYNQEVLADYTTGYFVNPAAFIGAGAFGLPVDLLSVFDSTPLNADSDESTVSGLFGAIHYDVSDNFAIDLEGRFQSDEVKRFGIRSPSDTVKADFDDFLPRVIGTYQPSDETTFYGSYSQGGLPGDINFIFIGQSQAGRDILTGLEPTATEVMEAEELDSIEFGIKQSLFDQRLNYSLAVYFMDWKNLKAFTQGFISPAEQTELGTNNPIISLTIPADAELKGIEFDGTYRISDNFDLAFTFNWVDSEYTDYQLADYGLILGAPGVGIQFAGKTVPRFPETSGSLSGTYRQQARGDWQWYVRGDVFYRGKTYTDPGNLSWIDSHSIVNLRTGFERDSVRVELFVTNLTDDDNFLTGRRLNDSVFRAGNLGTGGAGLVPAPVAWGPVFGAVAVDQGLALEAPDQRQFGIHVSYRF